MSHFLLPPPSPLSNCHNFMNPSPSVTSFMDGPKDQDPLPAIEEIKETLQALKEIKELLQEFPTQLEAAKICKSREEEILIVLEALVGK
ncbi:hypothetical protein AVEN_220785-1 [Araneus ventricosus]|uniref:Uncharacterized protein n=1 Tax=Araneus ventricosus TaxID=182803 RepID=A0A4Y2T863_ARAVE|nr:hypothetical protein AVEN_220785-1 [Araneus ventricosus]